ncbi:MAG: N-acetylmuramoyl-L-alanine amidase [Bacilli bacterium]
MKKYKILILFAICFIFMKQVDAFIFYLPLKDKIIFLDAGHGSPDPGSIYINIYEKDINLAIVYKLKEELIKQGATVYLTRENDKDLAGNGDPQRKRSDLYKRVKMINNSNPDLYLSIHLNSSINTSYHGAQSFYYPINDENKKIAKTFQKIFNERINVSVRDKNVKKITDLYMYKIVRKPGILIEVGFLSNANERKLLQQEDYQTRLAQLMTTAAIDYFENKKIMNKTK